MLVSPSEVEAGGWQTQAYLIYTARLWPAWSMLGPASNRTNGWVDRWINNWINKTFGRLYIDYLQILCHGTEGPRVLWVWSYVDTKRQLELIFFFFYTILLLYGIVVALCLTIWTAVDHLGYLQFWSIRAKLIWTSRASFLVSMDLPFFSPSLSHGTIFVISPLFLLLFLFFFCFVFETVFYCVTTGLVTHCVASGWPFECWDYWLTFVSVACINKNGIAVLGGCVVSIKNHCSAVSQSRTRCLCSGCPRSLPALGIVSL